MQDLYLGNESALKHNSTIEEKLNQIEKASATNLPTGSDLVISVKMTKKSSKNLKKNLKDGGVGGSYLSQIISGRKDETNNNNSSLINQDQSNDRLGPDKRYIFLWQKSKNLRWNTDGVRNSDLKRFEIIKKDMKKRKKQMEKLGIIRPEKGGSMNKVEIPASGIYELIENRLIGPLTSRKRK